jgi:hypothetical protein
MKEAAETLIEIWKKRHIGGSFVATRQEAVARMLELIPPKATVGFSGSQTLEQIGAVKALQARATPVFDQYQPGITKEQSRQLRRQGACAEYYLASANGIAGTGELVFLSAFGNRIAGVSNAPGVLIVCGMNKVVDTLDEALRRAREYATPLNCKRLNWNTPCFREGVCNKTICEFDEYTRMCCQLLVIEAEVNPGRLNVILVGETLGF